MASFTLVFFISYVCFSLGNYAVIAATPDQLGKFGLKWAMGLTGEAGFIIALLVGIFIGNFMPGLAGKLKDALRPEMYVKIAIVILGAELGVKAVDQMSLASAIIFRGLCAIVEAYLIYWALVYSSPGNTSSSPVNGRPPWPRASPSAACRPPSPPVAPSAPGPSCRSWCRPWSSSSPAWKCSSCPSWPSTGCTMIRW